MTDQLTLRSVSCLKDEEIWTCSDTSMRLCNLEESTSEGNQNQVRGVQMHLMVTKIGDLVYTDYDDRTELADKDSDQTTGMVTLRCLQYLFWRPSGFYKQ